MDTQRTSSTDSPTPTTMRIAILDTDKALADQIRASLEAVGHTCHSFPRNAPEQSRGEGFDLLILDSHEKKANIRETIQAARAWFPAQPPILLLSERADEAGIIAALDAGASDYIVKPVRFSELVTRIRVLLKRAYPERTASEQLQFGAYTFEPASGRATVAGKPLMLTQKEFDLALLFFRHLGRPLSRAYIQEAIWSHDPDFASRTIDTHVSRVRTKLGLRPENGYRLAPVYSYGYQLEEAAE